MREQCGEELAQMSTDVGFHELLSQLAHNRDKEVQYLRAEVEHLRSTLGICGEAKEVDSATIQEVNAKDNAATPLRAAANKEVCLPVSPAQHAPGKAPDVSPPMLPMGAPKSMEDDSPCTEVKDTTESLQGFELKGAWVTVPVASGSWGHELDNVMVESQANKRETNIYHIDSGLLAEVCHLKAASGQTSLCEQLGSLSSYFLINPSCHGRVVWDLAGMLLIAFDMLSIPIMICFEPEEHWFSTFMGWLTLVFWTCDVFGSLFTGYYSNGKLVMKQSKIIKQYLKGWFWVDMVVVVPDWVMKAMGSMTSIAGLGRILRAARIMRILRMLRLLKLKKLLALVYDMIDSEYMWIVFSLIRLLTILLVMNHLVACAWFMVGRLGKGVYPKNWLEDSGMTPVWDKDLGWRYLTSLHWSITQFTPASMDISATNSLERIFSISILFWALICLSSVIGNVSASMTALRNMSSDELQKFWMLRRYFKQKQISRDLSERIVKYLEYECAAKKDIVPNIKVALLRDVSENLMLELANEMHAPLLTCHPFFKHISVEIPAMMFRLCHTALRTASYAIDDKPFLAGDEGTSMYFFKHGLFEYKLVDGHILDTPLGPKTWASEAVLWTVWRHRGTLTALRPSEVTEIRPGEFIDVFHMHPRPWHLGRQYGAQFVEYMNCINRTALTDVIFDNDIFAKLVIDFDDPYSPEKMCAGRASTELQVGPDAKQAWA